MEKTLADMKSGEKGKIIKICKGHGFGKGRCPHRGHGSKRDLNIIGIREGRIIEVQTKQPFGGPVVVKIDNMCITLGRRMSKRIIVEVGS